jgi:hypothetical protein
LAPTACFHQTCLRIFYAFRPAFDYSPGAIPLHRASMNDIIFVGIVVAFFVASGFYVRFCAKL